ncbi:MAG: hypothetical protein KC636_31815, partial [Myxococcales bacterium]|nr:hypothetical protein [Myxococcales bacterium]
MDADIVSAVIKDYRTAPVSDGMRAIFAFIEKVVERPRELSPADAAEVIAAGVSADALREAMYSSFTFATISRFADSFGFTMESDEQRRRLAFMLSTFG